MSTINANDLRIENAKSLVENLSGGTSYIFISKPTEWSTGDDTPPVPTNTTYEYHRTYDEMLSAKKIENGESYHMIPRLDWTSGVIFDMYRHDYTQLNRSASGASNLYEALYIVINQNYEVYACLFNNNNEKSLVEPRSSTDAPFYTSDGYQWIRLYTLTPDQRVNYITDNYVPVSTTDLVNDDSGAINTVVVDTPGTNYTTSPAGVTNQIPYYYASIIGDGAGAVARVKVNNGSVTEIEVVRHGFGYTYAEMVFSAGNVYSTISDLEKGINSLNPLGDGNFNSTVILSPIGGWGTDIIRETGGTRVGIFSSLMFDDADFFSDVTFRRVGVLTDPTFINGYPTTATGCPAIAVDDIGGVETYIAGETIRQTVVDPTSGTEYQAIGTVVSYDTDNNILRYIQNPELHLDSTGRLVNFQGTRFITGDTSEKIVQPDTTVNGDLGDTTFSTGFAPSELNKYTGSMVYLANISPVLRQNTQTERVSLIIAY